jgi:hypothetical protein
MTLDDKILEYDRSIRLLLPAYDEMMAAGASTLLALTPPNARIIDLGAGSGRASEAILLHRPHATVRALNPRVSSTPRSANVPSHVTESDLMGVNPTNSDPPVSQQFPDIQTHW